MTTPVPGPPASVLAAILIQDPAHTYDAGDPRQRRLATFTTSPSPPDLPSLMTEVVFLPEYALVDANIQTTGYLSTQGLPGATAASRYVGATTSGAPTSGTFEAGDFVIGQSGIPWVCTVTGSPGIWAAAKPPPWITLPANWYAGPWFTGKAALATTPMWVLFDGDSITNGINPANLGDLATGWPDQLRTSLLASTGASVYGDFYAFWAYTQNAGNPVNEGFPTPLLTRTDYEVGFGTSFSCNTGGWMQTVSTGNIPGWTGGLVTGFDLVYYDMTAATWGFTIDGGQGTGTPVVTGATWNVGDGYYLVTNSGGSYTGGNVKKVQVTGLTAGTHTIEYGQLSVSQSTMFVGLSLYTGNTGGLGFVRSAYSGHRAVDSATVAAANASFAASESAAPNDRPALWSGYGPTNATAQITPTPFGFPTQPTLAFIGYGVNDTNSRIRPANFADAIYRKIIAVRRGVANANIALIAFAYPDYNNSDNALGGNGNYWSRYKTVLKDLAEAYNCAYIDVDSAWAGHPVANGWMVSGNVHPTATGHQWIANEIAGIL